MTSAHEMHETLMIGMMIFRVADKREWVAFSPPTQITQQALLVLKVPPVASGLS